MRPKSIDFCYSILKQIELKSSGVDSGGVGGAGGFRKWAKPDFYLLEFSYYSQLQQAPLLDTVTDVLIKLGMKACTYESSENKHFFIK